MNESENNYFNLACVVQFLICSGLTASTEGWTALRRLSWKNLRVVRKKMKVFEWGKSHQRSCEAGTLREKSRSRVRTPSGGNPVDPKAFHSSFDDD